MALLDCGYSSLSVVDIEAGSGRRSRKARVENCTLAARRKVSAYNYKHAFLGCRFIPFTIHVVGRWLRDL
jgi:hypothetical protein